MNGEARDANAPTDLGRLGRQLAYILDFNDPAKEAAFSRLDDLLRIRDRWRRLWEAARLRRGAEEIPVHGSEDLIA